MVMNERKINNQLIIFVLVIGIVGSSFGVNREKTVWPEIQWERAKPEEVGMDTSILLMGRDYALLTLEQEEGQLMLKQTTCYGAEHGRPEKVVETMPVEQNEMVLRVKVSAGGICQFAYSRDGDKYSHIGEPFQAKEGKWIGAKVGIFCARPKHENNGGYANYDWFRIH